MANPTTLSSAETISSIDAINLVPDISELTNTQGKFFQEKVENNPALLALACEMRIPVDESHSIRQIFMTYIKQKSA